MTRHLSFLHLEVLSRSPERTARPTPLLFVHGSYLSAWCWDEHFLPYFAARGYPAYALSLRGHGGSSGQDRLPWHSLRDYVDDLRQVADALPRPPVLIGHSMGGMVVQKYLERFAAPATVLMASVPPTGLLEMSGWLALTRPQLLADLWLAHAGAVQLARYSEVRKALFSDHLPDSLVQRYLLRTQSESQRALLDMSGWDLPGRVHQRPPTLVLGADDDALVPTFSVHSTAAIYATEAELFTNMGHVMMLEPAWQQVADRILTWLAERGL